MLKLSKDEIREAISKSSSMAAAAASLGVHFVTFKRYAQKFDLYKPNQGNKGTSKPTNSGYTLEDIFAGTHPEYNTFKLKIRLLREGILENKCLICGITSWNDKEINCELDHIDGNKYNHALENLRILCPNCHSQTPTFRSKKRKLIL